MCVEWSCSNIDVRLNPVPPSIPHIATLFSLNKVLHCEFILPAILGAILDLLEYNTHFRTITILLLLILRIYQS